MEVELFKHLAQCRVDGLLLLDGELHAAVDGGDDIGRDVDPALQLVGCLLQLHRVGDLRLDLRGHVDAGLHLLQHLLVSADGFTEELVDRPEGERVTLSSSFLTLLLRCRDFVGAFGHRRSVEFDAAHHRATRLQPGQLFGDFGDHLRVNSAFRLNRESALVELQRFLERGDALGQVVVATGELLEDDDLLHRLHVGRVMEHTSHGELPGERVVRHDLPVLHGYALGWIGDDDRLAHLHRSGFAQAREPAHLFLRVVIERVLEGDFVQARGSNLPLPIDFVGETPDFVDARLHLRLGQLPRRQRRRRRWERWRTTTGQGRRTARRQRWWTSWWKRWWSAGRQRRWSRR